MSLHIPIQVLGATALPFTLEPGVNALQFIPLPELKRAVSERALNPAKLVVVAATGHGDKSSPLSKQVIKALTEG